MKIVTVEQMIDLEQKSADVGAPPDFLMENAGLAIANCAGDLLGDARDCSVIVLVGPGNNGGDGLVAARHLHDWGAKVSLFLVKRKTENDNNFNLDMERNIPSHDAMTDQGLSVFQEEIANTDLFIDSLFGTGRIRPFEGTIKEILESVKQEKDVRPSLKVLAVDLPSGLDADTGAVDPLTLKADLTVTFACPKVGLYKFPGAAYLGQLIVADIQIPEYLSDHINTELITPELVRLLLPDRPLNANKGTFGKLLVIAGSANYVGAAFLACQGAMRAGAGLVTLATPRSVYPLIAGRLSECTYLPLDEDSPGYIGKKSIEDIAQQIGNYDGVLLGCGLGQDPSTKEFVNGVMDHLSSKPIVIDADGLNIVSEIENWAERITSPTVFTPHPGEMARLSGKAISDILESRMEYALDAARNWKQIVVLKGAFTLIASPDGKVRISPVANPGLASAGTGDVLAGVIAGFIAQGISLFDAATCGVYVHAMAGEFVKAEIGDTGMIAGDILPAIPITVRELKEGLADWG